MNSTNSLKLFELTQEFIKDEGKANTFVEKIEATLDDKMELRLQNPATKDDLAALRLEVRDQKVALIEVVSQQKDEVNENISKLKEDINESTSKLKKEVSGSILELKE